MITEQTITVLLEWMLVPQCLDEINQMLYSNEFYAIAELIESAIPKSDCIDLKDTYYTKEMLEGLLK